MTTEPEKPKARGGKERPAALPAAPRKKAAFGEAAPSGQYVVATDTSIHEAIFGDYLLDVTHPYVRKHDAPKNEPTHRLLRIYTLDPEVSKLDGAPARDLPVQRVQPFRGRAALALAGQDDHRRAPVRRARFRGGAGRAGYRSGGPQAGHGLMGFHPPPRPVRLRPGRARREAGASPRQSVSIRSSRRIGQNGEVAFDLNAQVLQKRMIVVDGRELPFYGGSTIVIGPRGEVRYVISKNIDSPRRLARMQQFATSPAGR